LWTHIERHAKDRGLAFSVSIEDAWAKFEQQGRRCALSGVALSMTLHKAAYAMRTASLDRIDNAKGYTTGNIQWLHKDVNRMKGAFSTDRFIELCVSVAIHPPQAFTVPDANVAADESVTGRITTTARARHAR
jgi:hypothetical protein